VPHTKENLEFFEYRNFHFQVPIFKRGFVLKEDRLNHTNKLGKTTKIIRGHSKKTQYLLNKLQTLRMYIINNNKLQIFDLPNFKEITIAN
jgi:hypothetical protein